MKKIGLISNECKADCFQPEYCWWKQLLATLVIILILQFFAWLIG